MQKKNFFAYFARQKDFAWQKGREGKKCKKGKKCVPEIGKRRDMRDEN